jgi:hypothetical protein
MPLRLRPLMRLLLLQLQAAPLKLQLGCRRGACG